MTSGAGATAGRRFGVAMVVLGVLLVLAAIGLVLAFRWVMRGSDPEVLGQVGVTATVIPQADGARVEATVRLVSGKLPARLVAPDRIQDPRYLQREGAGGAGSATSAVRDVVIDGEPVDGGEGVEPTGSTVRVSYVVERRSDGVRWALVESPFEQLQARAVTVTPGPATTCLQPAGYTAADDNAVWVASCAGQATATAVRAVPDDSRYRRQTVPAWVRLTYDPT